VRVGDGENSVRRIVPQLVRLVELRTDDLESRRYQRNGRRDADWSDVSVDLIHNGDFRRGQIVDGERGIGTHEVILVPCREEPVLNQEVRQNTSLIVRPDPRQSLRGTVVIAIRSSLIISRRSIPSTKS
jgi:hypothetical protein